jgi:GNAT superfamily N-acetyltransferase
MHVELTVAFSIRHSASPCFWSKNTGLYWWLAELSVQDSDDPEASPVVIGTAQMLSLDIRECEDFVADADYISGDLGVLASAAKRAVTEDYHGTRSYLTERILLIEDVVLDPHWRGRQLGPSMVKVAARAIGGIGAIFLTPSPLPIARDTDGVWRSSYEGNRPVRAQAKVRKAWKDANFTRRSGTVYWLPLWDEAGVSEADRARGRISAIQFGRNDELWWASCH